MIENWGDGASWEKDKSVNPHESVFLKLDCSKAANYLNWHPKWNLNYTLKELVEWHKKWINGRDMKKECFKTIKLYN